MPYDDDEFCMMCPQWIPGGCKSTGCSHSPSYDPNIKIEDLTIVLTTRRKKIRETLDEYHKRRAKEKAIKDLQIINHITVLNQMGIL